MGVLDGGQGPNAPSPCAERRRAPHAALEESRRSHTGEPEAARSRQAKRARAKSLGTIALALTAGALLMAALPRAVAAEERNAGTVTLAIVVGRDSKVDNVSRTLLRRAYLSERPTGPDGGRLIPLNHPPRTPDRVGFDRVVLDMNPDQVGRFWIDRRIRGGARPPRVVDNVTTLRRLLSQLPGTLAYLRPNQLDDSIRAVTVDGKKPEDERYPIVYQR